MTTVFLGGTCNNSTWREKLIEMLTIDYFNPVVPDWTEECYQEELHQRELCDYCIYTITPKMNGIYSIAEAVDDSNKQPKKTIVCVLLTDGDTEFDKGQTKSLLAFTKMIAVNGGLVFGDLSTMAEYLNTLGEHNASV